MAKKVRYNGGTMSYYGCSDPQELVVGKIYEVIDENERRWQTDYTLKGVKGHFNSTYMALAREIPTVGKELRCVKVEFSNIHGRPQLVECCTSIVQKVSNIGTNIYHVSTLNSVYIVQVD